MDEDEQSYRLAQAINRPSLWTAVAVFALLVAFARPGGADEPVLADESGPKPRVLASPSASAADGGTVRLVEHGFTRLRDPSGEHRVSWGLIVENTSRTSVVSVPITVDILDARGRQLITKTSAHARERKTAFIPPGGRFGLGDATYVARDGARRLRFTLGKAEWIKPNDLRAVRLTASLVKGDLHRVDRDQFYLLGEPLRAEVHRTRRHDLTITFRVESGASEVLGNGHASAILRDSTGKIVGGTHPADTVSWTRFPPGWSIQRIRATGVPPTVDPRRIEVYPQPSYF
ncbi:hypothetical protein Acsp03_40710 [Actinomadura sp. NBRC 104412]|uniref:hypothetical protein n=1 Tax=Actinomadura sp. NBRC 104412 TaxID=3032203 RepID=UPI0024A47171|nr:hypothetical protein [Actinomadura sp. NBRC 104412]GLZ06605.1 hypothetical protein Acsp03_40710 [Actinomadura sp. NBRC 104412]